MEKTSTYKSVAFLVLLLKGQKPNTFIKHRLLYSNVRMLEKHLIIQLNHNYRKFINKIMAKLCTVCSDFI